MKKLYILFISLIFLGFFVSTTFASFPDVSLSHPNVTAIEYLQNKMIVAGYNDGNFNPESKINRAEFLKIVIGAKYAKNDIDMTGVSTSLSDVKNDDWFAKYVAFSIKNKIVGGYPDLTFKPGNNINLAEAMKIIVETYKIPKPVYTQAPVNWYDPYIDVAISYNLLVKVSSRNPTTTITRGDVAQIIYNTLNISTTQKYAVTKIVDGDTIDIDYNGKTERIRLIGVDTPETVHPSKPVECFGLEASNKTKELLTGKSVGVEFDLSQGERDSYGRLLAYVFLEEINMNEKLIRDGYAFEYTYSLPYKYQKQFQDAEEEAKINNRGLWNSSACNEITSSSESNLNTNTSSAANNTANPPEQCTIKGNISSSGEKIYHMEGCQSYTKTVINESAGERWFCSSQEAVDAGWRMAGNC